MPRCPKGGDCRSPFHKLKIKEKKKFLLITERTTSCSLPMLIIYQKSPADGLCFIRWAGSRKSAEILVRKMWLMPMGQHCSNQVFSRDLFVKHLSVLFQHRLAEGKTSSFKERSALCNTAKLPAQVGIPCQPVPWQMSWCCWSKQSKKKITVFLPGNWAAGRLLQLSQRETLKKPSLFLLFGSCSTVPCLIQLF